MSLILKGRTIKPVQNKKSMKVMLKNSWQLYVLILPAVLYFLVFSYLPMYGIQVAFKDYKFVDGITGSQWVGLDHFRRFFETYYFKRLLSNTLLLNIFHILWSNPWPLILAILLNQIRSDKTKRLIQTTIYIPHFISTVVLAGMLYLLLAPTSGVFNRVITSLGGQAIDFMSKPSAFRTIYISSGIWQDAGFSSILFIATLSSVDPGLYEAAEIDGASIWQKIKHIDLPALLPTFMMTFILDFGRLLSNSADKVLLLQTPGNVPVSDIISVYVYNMGLGSGQFSYTSAIGLFTNVVNYIMIVIVNKISKKVTEVGLF